MRTILFVTAALIHLVQAPVFAQPCNCLEQFDWLQQKLALNYSGYRDKVTAENKAAFEQHTAAFREKIAASTADTNCLRLLTDWSRWFRDGHVQLYLKGGGAQEAPEVIRARYAGWEHIDLTEAAARAYLDLPGRDPMEGIYKPGEGSYRVALIRKASPERDFAAIILNADSVWWMPGQVKFDLKQGPPGQYTARYYMRDHSERNPAVTFEAGKLSFTDLGAWYRQYPGKPVAPEKTHVFTIARLDTATLLLRVPTMNEGVRQELDSLINANSTQLERTPNLIIDCRGNGGGSDITFLPLQPYVYSGPVKGYNMQTYATDDNIEKYRRLRTNKDFPKKYRRYFSHIERKLRRNKGKFVGKCKEATEGIKKIKPYPRKIAILIDGGCASSCEQFVYNARQSNRVTLIGQHTAGIFDYGNLHSLEFPCGQFTLWYPTSRSCRVDAGQGIDGKGIPPGVRIDDEKTDWVAFARDYLMRK